MKILVLGYESISRELVKSLINSRKFRDVEQINHTDLKRFEVQSSERQILIQGRLLTITDCFGIALGFKIESDSYKSYFSNIANISPSLENAFYYHKKNPP
ncbi:hypothetical protein L1267_19100 [Pseudoalteromonas sp. OFAV1]|uniref:hypothetical protein n=1 Tax=Pseudoalteromonas sp. OFAV1 TaxID=2908892 RepID=UPI001F35960A|nr:hypothetical protein [Pseudoalteromonas sp. OFAV1]MCF2902482.1 hypothetical protein [Pseudoalteromonas sp. OFAV1]